MKLFLCGELTVDNYKEIIPDSQKSAPFILEGYEMKILSNGVSYVIPKQGASINGFVIDVSEKDIWTLDQWKNPIYLSKIKVADELFSYSVIENNQVSLLHCEKRTFESFNNAAKHPSIKRGDVHLLIPGFYSNAKRLENVIQSVGAYLQEQIAKSANQEFADDYLKNTSRYSLGEISIQLTDDSDYMESAILNLMIHNETNLCVVDVYIPMVRNSIHKVLFHYCANTLKVKLNGETKGLSELLTALGITLYGNKRSIVFSYDEMDEESVLNLLVNEDNPMGKIVGKHFIDIAHDNYAQYDTAKVYVSETTMLEITKEASLHISERIDSQALEIFFVEMLLLLDASVNKMNYRVKDELEKERSNPFRKDSKRIINELIREMSQSVRFGDFKQFYFPTVRVSAEKIAKAFGIDYIESKYEQNKVLLEKMIAGNNAEISEKENKIKNSLLLVITALSGSQTINEALKRLAGDKLGNYSYFVALGIVAAGFLIYNLTMFIIKRRLKKKR